MSKSIRNRPQSAIIADILDAIAVLNKAQAAERVATNVVVEARKANDRLCAELAALVKPGHHKFMLGDNQLLEFEAYGASQHALGPSGSARIVKCKSAYGDTELS